MLKWVLEAFGGTIIEAVIKSVANAFRLRRLDRERDAAISGQAVSEARGAALEQQNQVRKDMADAQVNAPGSRDSLAERLLREADAAEAAATPPT